MHMGCIDVRQGHCLISNKNEYENDQHKYSAIQNRYRKIVTLIRNEHFDTLNKWSRVISLSLCIDSKKKPIVSPVKIAMINDGVHFVNKKNIFQSFPLKLFHLVNMRSTWRVVNYYGYFMGNLRWNCSNI